MERNGTLDYARLAAAAGIIVFHVGGPGASIGYAALPFFLMLLVFLAFAPAADQGFPAYSRARIVRLLKPWAAWSLVYGALKLVDVVLGGRSLDSEFAAWMLLTGPALHLWFLPFACIVCLALWPFAQGSNSLRPAGRQVLAAIGLTLAAVVVAAGQDAAFPVPFAQWLDALPAVLMGCSIALLKSDANADLKSALALVGLVCFLLLLSWPPGSTRLVVATVVLLLCLGFAIPSTPSSRSFADLALTLYLAHPIVISLLLRLTPVGEGTLMMTVFAVFGTILFSIALRRLGMMVTARTASA